MSQSEKRGFRRILALILLAAALILAAAFVLLLPKIKEWFPAEGTTPVISEPAYKTLSERDPDTLASITVSHLGGETYTLFHQDGVLTLETEAGGTETVSPALAANFIKYATTVYIDDTVSQDENEVREHLADMGLDPPQIQVTAAFSDGSETLISLGFAVEDTDYRYYRWSGDDGVYLCSSGVYETFGSTAELLLQITQPVIDASLIERVSIQPDGGEPIVCAFETDGEGMAQGALLSPFAYPMAAEATQDLIAAVANFRLGARLKPVTDETRGLYGLGVPQAVVTIAQREGLYSQTSADGALQSFALPPSAITLTFGDAEGEFFRYCEYEGTCYRVSGFLTDAFLRADAADFAARNPADMGGYALRDIAVQTGGGALDVRASYLENVLPNNELETDEYGNVVCTTEVTANGESITAEAFGALVDRLKQMTVSGRLDAVTEPAGAPRWQMTLTTEQGKTRTLAAYPMDAFNDVLAVDGVAVHYISNEALEIALGEFAALPEPAHSQ